MSEQIHSVVDKEIEKELAEEIKKIDELHEKLEELVKITYLTPENTVFRTTEGGFVSMEIIGGAFYPRVNMYRIFPFRAPNEYISVRDPNDKEENFRLKNVEVGIIRDLSIFDSQQAEIINTELARRYFLPEITEVTDVKEEYGYCYWKVETDAGNIRFTSRSGNNVLIPKGGYNIIVIDVDGNRYEIKDYSKLNNKVQKIIESYL